MMEDENIYKQADTCVLCGKIIPDGKTVCAACEEMNKYKEDNDGA